MLPLHNVHLLGGAVVGNQCLFKHAELVGATVSHETVHQAGLEVVQALQLRLFPRLAGGEDVMGDLLPTQRAPAER